MQKNIMRLLVSGDRDTAGETVGRRTNLEEGGRVPLWDHSDRLTAGITLTTENVG